MENESENSTPYSLSRSGHFTLLPPRSLTHQSVLEPESSHSEPENSTPDSPSYNNIGPQVMEYRPHSLTGNSTTRLRLTLRSIPQDSVLKHYVLTRNIITGSVHIMKPITQNRHAYDLSSFTTGLRR